MLMANLYTVRRDEICVGKVITDFNLDEKILNLDGKVIRFGDYYKCRNILFTKDFNNATNDLLYASPQYPVFNGQNKEECKKSKFIIVDDFNLSEILRYLNYDKELSFLDVLALRDCIFKRSFLIENIEKFGFKIADPEYQPYFDEKGKRITDTEKLKKLIKQRRRSLALRGDFDYVEDEAFESLTPEQLKHFLSYDLFKILLEYRDNSIYDVLFGYEEHKNSFKPAKEEGPIRSLKKYE